MVPMVVLWEDVEVFLSEHSFKSLGAVGQWTVGGLDFCTTTGSFCQVLRSSGSGLEFLNRRV